MNTKTRPANGVSILHQKANSLVNAERNDYSLANQKIRQEVKLRNQKMDGAAILAMNSIANTV